MRKRPEAVEARLDREQAIRHMAESMRKANPEHIVATNHMTMNMGIAWQHYVEACRRVCDNLRDSKSSI